tara:strand:+ start:270 stop:551 length:282 start_codon:yes stop_codon:yes gene_type:complete
MGQFERGINMYIQNHYNNKYYDMKEMIKDIKNIYQALESRQIKYEMLFSGYIANNAIPDDIKKQTLDKLILDFENNLKQLQQTLENESETTDS